jgi:hypothetical protein
MSAEPSSADHTPDGQQQPDEAAPARDIETQLILRRLRNAPPSFRVLLWDAVLGIALGILLVVVLSLMFKPLQWVTAGITGH